MAVANVLSPTTVAVYIPGMAGNYIFQRDGSTNWWIKLRSGGKRIERSLGTSDRREAEVLAAPLIGAHKARLLAARPRLERIWRHRLEPGREHVGEDGARIIATEKDLFYIDRDGAITKTEPNSELTTQAFNKCEPVRSIAFRSRKAAVSFITTDRPSPAKKNANGDDAILETYLTHANVSGYFEREAPKSSDPNCCDAYSSLSLAPACGLPRLLDNVVGDSEHRRWDG
jgi:hypothetical protein